MFIYDDLERNFDIITYYFKIFKEDYKIENEICKLSRNSSISLKNKVSKLFDISNRVSKILQVGFDPYKIIIFLNSSFHSKITILDCETENTECFNFLKLRFPDRLNRIDTIPLRESLNKIVTYSFEKFNIIDIVNFQDVYIRLCFYLSNSKTILLCDQYNTNLKEILSFKLLIEDIYIFNYNLR